MKTTTFLLIAATFLSGCGGSKILKEPEPLVVTQALANGSDQQLSATLDWVIVRDGPGTWAKNADWDEYFVRVQNLSGETVQLASLVVVDSLGTVIHPEEGRAALVKGTKKTMQRYEGEGLTVKAGVRGTTLMAAGAVTAVTAMSVGAAAALSSSAVAGAAVGGIVLAPVLAVGGVFRGVNNSKVNKQIQSRQTVLPIELQVDEEQVLDIFFPLSPSPKRIELNYVDSRGEHTLFVDTTMALEGLHLLPANN